MDEWKGFGLGKSNSRRDEISCICAFLCWREKDFFPYVSDPFLTSSPTSYYCIRTTRKILMTPRGTYSML